MKRHLAKSTPDQFSGKQHLMCWITFLFALSLMVSFNYAGAASTDAPVDPVLTNEKFDHAKTGFNLTGAHYTARCVSCHINNILKGTPRECAGCHIPGNRMSATAKPTNHVLTNEKCDTCHKTSLWTPAAFSHVGMAEGGCNTCHNGSTATGKPRTHIVTSISCDSCHKTTDWFQAAFSHKGITGGCSTCHGQTFQGMTPTAKPNNHMVTSEDCSVCHITTTFVTMKPGAIIPLPTGHFPTTTQCGACHTGASFLPGRMNHIGISGNCVSCHNGQSFTVDGTSTTVTPTSMPSGHISTNGLPCEACHTSTVMFKIPVGTLLPMPAGHFPSSLPCSTCHDMNTVSNFIPGVMHHTGIGSGCADCHNGQSFLGVTPVSKASTGSSPAHMPTTMPCETCHSPSAFSSFAGTTMSHTGITGSCGSCHNDGMNWFGVTIVHKSDAVPTHMTTSQDCSGCHLPSTYQTFKGATGGTLPAGHITTVQPCSICHTTGYGAYSGMLQATNFGGMNHAGISNNCTSCHNGQTFTAGVGVTPMTKSDATVTHMDTSLDCYNCHSSTTTFAGASTSAKPANHLPTSLTCATCHSAGYGPGQGQMVHTGIVTGCATCHNGQSFTGVRPVSKANFPTHVATALDCSSCHMPNTNGFTSFAGASGGALPLNHISTTQPCTTCHTSYGANSGIMNHVGIVSGCANCHNGQTFAVGMKPVSKPTNHITTTLPCEICHSTTNFNTFAGTTMKHTGIVSGCATCHDVGKTFVGGIVTKLSNHVPTSGVTGGGACETCHSATNFSTFAGTAMKHTGITSNCEQCHGHTSYQGVTPAYKPSNHIPETEFGITSNTNCVLCHKSTVFTSFTSLNSSSTMHNGIQGGGTGGKGYCVTCHLSSATYLGNMRKSRHNSASTTRDCSSSSCHKPIGREGTTYSSW